MSVRVGCRGQGPRVPLVLAVCGLLLAGCLEQREAEVLPPPPSAACEGVAPRTLDEVYAAHFSAQRPTGCTAGCHEAGAGGLTFRDARELWRATVGQASTGEKTRLLVKPGRPEHSHLYLKLLPDAVGRMPVGGPHLEVEALRDVAGWICSWAPEPTGTGQVPPPDAGTSEHPVPRLDTLSPASVLVGAGEVSLALVGGGFVSTSTVTLDGAPLAATFVGPERLEVRVPAAVTATAGTPRLRVSNPPPGGGTSAEREFVIAHPVPALSGLTPSSVATHGAPFSLKLTGTGFTPASVVVLNGVDVATTYLGPDSLTGAIPTLSTAGTSTPLPAEARATPSASPPWTRAPPPSPGSPPRAWPPTPPSPSP